MERKEINLHELKRIELEILTAVHNVCEEHNIAYYLWGGTLLGAIRHGGFIPWDDDIDIAMTRSDFEVFQNVFSSDDYVVSTCESDPNYPYWHVKVYHKHSVKEEPIYYKNSPYFGVDIDIFLLDSFDDADHLADSVRWRMSQKRKSAMSLAANKNIPLHWRIIGFIYRNLLGVDANQIACEINSKCCEFDKNGSGLVLYADRNIKEPLLMDKKWFASRVLRQFEDRSFYIPVGYDALLTACYGDYMTPPPEEERVTHHTFVAYYK